MSAIDHCRWVAVATGVTAWVLSCAHQEPATPSLAAAHQEKAPPRQQSASPRPGDITATSSYKDARDESTSHGPNSIPPTMASVRRISGDMPRLPSAVLSSGSGYIEMVKICVATSGSVDSLKTVRSSNVAANQAVHDAVTNWKFKPLEINGHPVAFCYFAQFVFKSASPPLP